MSSTKWAALAVVGVLGCQPLPPEPIQNGQVPEFTVLTGIPPIGAIAYTLDAMNLEGTVTLDTPVATTHPVRLAVVWLEPRFSLFAPLWQSLPLQNDQQVISSFDGRAGAHSFSAALLPPPPEALNMESARSNCGSEPMARAVATMVLYVDTNENGRLDLSTLKAVDHVLSSGDFPARLAGSSAPPQLINFTTETCIAPATREEQRLEIYDDERLDLVSCAVEDRFARREACGIVGHRAPLISFFGERSEGEVSISISTLSDAALFLDGVPLGNTSSQSGIVFGDAQLGSGQHRLRAENRGGANPDAVFEATFTFPDRTWIKATRAIGGGEYEVHFQEVIGATRYDAIAGVQNGMVAGGTSSPLRLHMSDSVFVTANFGELPFRCAASAVVGRAGL